MRSFAARRGQAAYSSFVNKIVLLLAFVPLYKSEKDKFFVLIRAKKDTHEPHFFLIFSFKGLDSGVWKRVN